MFLNVTVSFFSSDIDECILIDPCRNGATCVNTDGSYTCFCEPGWQGKNCTIGKRSFYPHLNYSILNRLSLTIYWKSPIAVLGMSGYEIYIFLEKNG